MLSVGQGGRVRESGAAMRREGGVVSPSRGEGQTPPDRYEPPSPAGTTGAYREVTPSKHTSHALYYAKKRCLKSHYRRGWSERC